MALDQQRNWDISMAENLDHIMRKEKARLAVDSGDSSGRQDGLGNQTGEAERRAQAPASPPTVTKSEESTITPQPTWTSPPIYLPDEIIIHILDYIAQSRDSQRSLASCCRLSRQWYDAAVPLLYARPHLYGKNFEPFVRAICPSINLHVRKSPLSKLVRALDMGGLVHQGSKSMTARLLGRVKGGLEGFRAPVASFSLACLPALGKCKRLRSVDMSLVSESPPLPELFKTVAHLDELRTFKLPRSAGFGVHHKPSAFSWPPHLENLSLSGGIDAHFLHGVVSFPQSLKSLTIEHCPQAKGYAIVHLLRTAVRPLKNLETFTIRHMPRLGSRALDDILFLLPQIKRLSVSVDYISPAVFDPEAHISSLDKEPVVAIPAQASQVVFQHDDLRASVQQTPDGTPFSLDQHPLHWLELTNSGNPGNEDKISPIDILIALDEGSLPKLRQVRVAKTLLWHSNTTSSDAEALADALQEKAKRDWEMRSGVCAERLLQDGDGKEKEGERRGQQMPWEREAGVWMFDG